MRRVFALIFIVTNLLVSSPALGDDPSTADWTHLTEKHGVQVWRKEFPNSPVIAVRGILTLPYPIKDVFSVLTDNSRSIEWLPMISKKETIRQVTPQSRIEYARIRMPWPLKDRYTVAEGSLEIRPGNVYWISYKSVEGEYTEPNLIRAKLDMSTFYLRPAGDDMTYMDVTLLSDPMGSVPKFLVNTFQKNWPVEFLDGLKKQVEKVRAERMHPPSIGQDMSKVH